MLMYLTYCRGDVVFTSVYWPELSEQIAELE